MTWNSGPCDMPPNGAGAAYFSEADGMVCIPEADNSRERLLALATDEPERHLHVVRDSEPGRDR